MRRAKVILIYICAVFFGALIFGSCGENGGGGGGGGGNSRVDNDRVGGDYGFWGNGGYRRTHPKPYYSRIKVKPQPVFESHIRADSSAYPGQVPLWTLGMGQISRYDYIIRSISADWGYDWRFISAIAMAESRFDPDARSGAGAIGLMQIMPITARNFAVSTLHVEDPFINVSLAVELLDQINGTLHFPAWVSDRDKWSIILASYNAGLTHVLDARRLAVKYGENYNLWSVVSKYLVLKALPQYYEDDVVRAGRFGGSVETIGYVDKVIRYYDEFVERAPF